MQVIVLLIQFISVLSRIMVYALIARVLFSWFSASRPGAPRGAFEQFLHEITEPIMRIVRKLPHRAGMMDFSPIIAIFGIDLLSQLIIIMLSNLIR